MARPHIEPFVDRDVDFKQMTLPGFAPGMQSKMLSLDTSTSLLADRSIVITANTSALTSAGGNTVASASDREPI